MATRPLEALFNHLALPPRLPGKEDNIAIVENALLDHLLSTATYLQKRFYSHFQSSYDAVQKSLEACQSIHVNRHLDRQALSNSLASLQSPNVLILHIPEQNAGLLIWRKTT
jgi:hypothetical protein